MTDIRDQMKEYYGRILQGSEDLRTNACSCGSPPPKYVRDVLPLIVPEIAERFYGCGSPLPPALAGCTVLDLGCGTGRDTYAASKLVGPQGRVIGVDMTAEQIGIAQKHQGTQAKAFGYAESNVIFRQGYIEDLESLGIESETMDVVISNCVINLSPFKEQVFREIYRVLKKGGELYFSDIFADRRVPARLNEDLILRGECLGGALYTEDFRRLMQKCGWANFYYTAIDPVHITDAETALKVGDIIFTSRTVRALKTASIEDREEDYGQTAVYLGTMAENQRYFDLSTFYRFLKDRPAFISGNAGTMLQETRYGRHFRITGDRGRHYGLFASAGDEAAPVSHESKEEVPGITLAMLEEECAKQGIKPFHERVGYPHFLQTKPCLDTLQVNVGYGCNLACSHCFLECGPDRTEIMSRETMEECLQVYREGGFRTMDITGGSPEMNPALAWFIREASGLGQVIVRTNLVILDDRKYAYLMDVYKECKVKLVCSLPAYTEEAVDSQRGNKVFAACVKIIQDLNAAGYGRDPELVMDLVYNVAGSFLPPDQSSLEEVYKKALKQNYGIDFNHLLALGNCPLGRFGKNLKKTGKFGYFLKLQSDHFNPATVPHIMCRAQLNVDWDGGLYDCDYNHVLGLRINGPAKIGELIGRPPVVRDIITHPVCYSCTAASGSSCGGSLT